MHNEILSNKQVQLLSSAFFASVGSYESIRSWTAFKWKDYVDLYFLLCSHFTLSEISSVATQLFGELYSEKMFRSQLCYFDDVDYTEAVDYLIPNPPTDEEIKYKLTEISMQGLEL